MCVCVCVCVCCVADMEEFMKAQDLAPVVSYLCHENFPENGSTIESFGGWVSKGKVGFLLLLLLFLLLLFSFNTIYFLLVVFVQ